MSEAVANLWRQRPLIQQLVRRQVRRRYRGHIFGPIWPFLNPLALLVIYTLVFSVFLRIPAEINPDWDTGPGWEGHLRFALIAYAGLVAYTFFTDVLGSSSHLVRSEPNFVKKTVFPLEILAPVQVTTLLIDLAVGIGFLVLLQTLFWTLPTWHILLLPLALLPLVLFALAAGWILSAVATYIPDIAEFVSMFLRVYFFLTPVVYPLELVPEPWRTVMFLNPLASILYGIRNVTLFHRTLVWDSWGLTVAVGALACVLGHMLFKRLRPGFADVI